MEIFENLLSVRERDCIFLVNISKSALIVNDLSRISYAVLCFTKKKGTRRQESDVGAQFIVPLQMRNIDFHYPFSIEKAHLSFFSLTCIFFTKYYILDTRSVSYTHLRAHETRHDLV